jgi:hypothetical protein
MASLQWLYFEERLLLGHEKTGNIIVMMYSSFIWQEADIQAINNRTRNVTMRRVQCHYCCSGKAIRITYSECLFVALGIQHCYHGPARLYWILPHYLINGTNFITKSKVECTLVQALRLCTGRTAQRGSRGTALLYRHWGSVQAVLPIRGVEV